MHNVRNSTVESFSPRRIPHGGLGDGPPPSCLLAVGSMVKKVRALLKSPRMKRDIDWWGCSVPSNNHVGDCPATIGGAQSTNRKGVTDG